MCHGGGIGVVSREGEKGGRQPGIFSKEIEGKGINGGARLHEVVAEHDRRRGAPLDERARMQPSSGTM
ncbi:hypothetical protein E2562_031244 [Oryza meyeriana var. granulata]|uniref:Uncharacterized protein n=1 Tax=Oryza meyeriana var. granulata TaxID=110450 RepID=A0A6G1DRM2_9ORYZ|nr:hypothetical protein E2562_031244 [Oryza meyeriana var. granulata]